MSNVVNLPSLIDEQKVGKFLIGLVVLSFMIMLCDGYDFVVAANGAPTLVAQWHLKAHQLGPVFSASPFGVVIGAPLMGWMGDRIGRRYTVILGVLLFGVFTLGCAFATSLNQMMVMRFIAGIGLGGMLPNITALMVEFAPKTIRATCVVLMFLGVTAGSIAPGAIIALFPTQTDWHTLYAIGGVAPILMAVALMIGLPESIKFLLLRQNESTRGKVEAILKRVKPGYVLPADAVFVGPEAKRRTGVAELFKDGMHRITPLVWLLFICVLASNYFLYNWMPLVFHINGFSTSQSAMTTVSYYVGGVLGAITISRLIDKKGLVAVTIFFLLSCPVVACIGLKLPPVVIQCLVFVSGFFIFGVLLGLNALAGLLYPVRIRSTGAGWAFGMGRLGGIASPLIGASLLKMNLPISQLFVAPAIPLAIGTVACFVVMKLCYTRFGGYQFNDNADVAVTGLSAGAQNDQGLPVT